MDTLKKILSKQNNSDACVVCGKVNAHALGADFYAIEGGVLACVFTAGYEHQSYTDRIHGGMITAVLDETIGRAIQIENPDIWGVTGKIEVSFKKPAPLGKPLVCLGRIVRNSALSFVGKGYLADGETVIATATATYVKVPVDKLTDGGSFVWELFPRTDAPEFISVTRPELLE